MRRIEDFDVPAAYTELLEQRNLRSAAHLEACQPSTVCSPEWRRLSRVANSATPCGRSLSLIKADVGLEVAFADIDGWDTHANQGAIRASSPSACRISAQGISAFHQDLGDRMRNIVILTMTEFGRSVRQNGSGGTDHGHASALFVSGGSVKGKKVYGKWPGLAPDQLFEGRDLAFTTDFRDVFSEIVAKHMGVSDTVRHFPGVQAEADSRHSLIGDSF